MSQPATAEPVCPECGATVKPQDARCWLCHRSLVIEAEIVEPPVAHAATRPRANPAQFSLETLMLVITLIAVCLGLIVAAPGMGIVLAVVAAPALVRTLVAGYQERKAGLPMTLSEKLLTFVASTGVTIAVLAAGWVAFAVACLGSCLAAVGLQSINPSASTWIRDENTVFMLLFGVSGLVGLGTAGWIFWVLRPRRVK